MSAVVGIHQWLYGLEPLASASTGPASAQAPTCSVSVFKVPLALAV
ncbi:hypothetical protein F442_09188 [Phytophthora nicotianae P10297]|uniref:Uncharacterized protein n=3 Tax=Phytophthora nicotianae TaxID=4792 RepID=V9F6G8_PHYNI|nr:hypothetical protein F443_09263 [Phytophthora nicotianae P1569]ETO75015.1 hypothetical protein F444_09347 [Phytophthora nicotianae P1976]ETP44199.1 hypothetical protein F442_09188 [Phytophthora nicotianae P10297]